jgi:hypothetical protein
MKFYFRYVNGLEEPGRGKEEIDPAMLGTLLHDILKNIYEPQVGSVINAGLIDRIIKDWKEINRLIDQSLEDNFRNASFPYTAGNEMIVKDVLLKYIERILLTDKTYAPFTLLGVEKPFRYSVNQNPGNQGTDVIAGGRIDRIDLKDGITRVVDYKTGSVADHIGSIHDLFIDDRERDLDGWLQTLFYCEGYIHSNPGIKIVPSVYMIKKAPGELADNRLRIKQNKTDGDVVNDYDSVRTEFSEGLRSLIKTILSIDEPFVMTGRRWNKCGYCPYRVLCMR